MLGRRLELSRLWLEVMNILDVNEDYIPPIQRFELRSLPSSRVTLRMREVLASSLNNMHPAMNIQEFLVSELLVAVGANKLESLKFDDCFAGDHARVETTCCRIPFPCIFSAILCPSPVLSYSVVQLRSLSWRQQAIIRTKPVLT